MPALQPTPALARAVFAYQAEVKAAREAAKANPPAEMSAPEKPAAMDAPDKPLENKSMDNQPMEKLAIDGKAARKDGRQRTDAGERGRSRPPSRST